MGHVTLAAITWTYILMPYHHQPNLTLLTIRCFELNVICGFTHQAILSSDYLRSFENIVIRVASEDL